MLLAPLEKLTALFEDVFEAEDNLPADVDIESLPADWFSPLSYDGSSPLLHPNIIRKLSKYIGQVTRPTKRIRLSTAREGATGGVGTPRGKGRMSTVDTAVLSRTLKILDRTVRTGEDLDPFHYVATARDKTASPRKSKKSTRKPKANDGEEEEGQDPTDIDVVMDEPLPPQEATQLDLEHLTKIFEIAKDSVLAAECCIALLGSDRLTKQVLLIHTL